MSNPEDRGNFYPELNDYVLNHPENNPDDYPSQSQNSEMTSESDTPESQATDSMKSLSNPLGDDYMAP